MFCFSVNDDWTSLVTLGLSGSASCYSLTLPITGMQQLWQSVSYLRAPGIILSLTA